MSHKNPNVTDVIENSTSYRCMTKYLCKSYLNLAKKEFHQKYNRKPTIEDSNELFSMFALQWYDYYHINPKIDKLWYRKIGKLIYQSLIHTGCDLYSAGCRYIEYIQPNNFEEKDSNWKFDPLFNKHGYTRRNCGDILGDNCKPLRHIIRKGLVEDFVQWVIANKKHLPAYHKSRYVDYSHLAYNGVTDDF